MIKTARQLKDLIRNLSKEKSEDAQILLRNYRMERFLERMSLSKYQAKFILKGGMLVSSRVGQEARSTMDIDATIKVATVSIEEVRNISFFLSNYNHLTITILQQMQMDVFITCILL